MSHFTGPLCQPDIYCQQNIKDLDILLDQQADSV